MNILTFLNNVYGGFYDRLVFEFKDVVNRFGRLAGSLISAFLFIEVFIVTLAGLSLPFVYGMYCYDSGRLLSREEFANVEDVN